MGFLNMPRELWFTFFASIVVLLIASSETYSEKVLNMVDAVLGMNFNAICGAVFMAYFFGNILWQMCSPIFYPRQVLRSIPKLKIV